VNKVDNMHFATREDFIQWATVIIFTAQDFKTDTQAKDNAVRHAQELANLFFAPNAAQHGPNPNVYEEPPAVRPPPQVRQVVDPPAPGQRTNLGGQQPPG
jgi:hypothetical protein